MNKLFLATLTRAINTYLHLDEESKHRLARLEGHIITIELIPFHFIFHLIFHADRVEVTSDENIESQAKITGTPLQLFHVVKNKKQRNKAFTDEITIEGNAEIANEVIKLFDQLEIDWEEHAARVAGDVPVHYASRVLHKAANFLRHAEESFTSNVNEYVHEEKEWLPSRERLNDFFVDVDTLRMDVDRAEARIKYLQSMFGNNTPTDNDEGLQ